MLALAFLLSCFTCIFNISPANAASVTATFDASDAFLTATDEVYNTAWTATSGSVTSSGSELIIGQDYTVDYYVPPYSWYDIYRSALLFDTSSIPDGATINSVTLSLYTVSANNFYVAVKYSSTRPSNPVASTDYNKAYYSTQAGSGYITATNAYYNISLYSTFVSTTGLSRMILQSYDDAIGTPPTENSYIICRSSESGYGAKLYVTYTTGSTVSMSSDPAIGATYTVNGSTYTTPNTLSLESGSVPFVADESIIYGGSAYLFAHWLVNGTLQYNTSSINLDITGATTIAIHYTEYSNVLWFYGPYDEETGLLLNENVTVTVHHSYNATADYSFIVNGTDVYPATLPVLYLTYTFEDSSTREYWIDPSETVSNFYIFKGNNTNSYVINFLDYTGLLETYPYVTAQAYINGSLFTVEKRRIDAQNSIMMNLIEGELYQLSIGNEDYTYVYGDVLCTSTLGIQLTLRGTDFPKETLLMYPYLTVYALRDYDTNSIYFFYNDTKEATTSVNIVFTDAVGTVAYNQTYVANTIVLNWTSATATTSYQLNVVITHSEYGEIEWNQYFVGSSGEATALFSLSFLGDWSINMTYLIPAILILFAAMCFSAINAEVGAILSVIAAIILTWIGWIPIPAGFLVAGFALAVLMALVYNKRRTGYY